LFIEKPVDCSIKGFDYLLRLVVEHQIPSYVAYPFRFNADIKKFKKENNTNYLNIIRCLTNLDSWRGYQTYSAKKSQGGGALLELSHEIDLAEYLFGEIVEIKGNFYSHGRVQTDAEEVAVLYARHKNCSTHIVLDIASGREERTINTNSIMSYFATDKMYFDQLIYFFDNIDNSRMMNNLPDASILFRKIMGVRGE
jgi:predicted dehydrogenase